ncbi:MAG: IS200/IS605 family transposase [Thermoplasmata archaeon]|nr:IS200/IS605 family transposase [Thermoplasmata archaeon]
MNITHRNDRHTTSMLTDHIVITPKFRGVVLVGKVGKECERQIRWTCKKMDVKILEMAVASDHVHLFVQYPPRLSPSRIVELIKTQSSRELRKKFPQLRSFHKTALWAPGCYHGSVGQGFDVVEKYISIQRYDHKRPSIVEK